MIKWGYNVDIKDMKSLDEVGFDYFETAIAPIAEMDDAEYEKVKELFESLKTPVLVFNVLLPGSIKVVGDEYSKEKCSEYLEKALFRAKELGAEKVVFGSGGAKRIPDGFDREKAMEQLHEFVKILAEKAKKYELIIPIEALRRAECNCINNLDEGESLCDSAESENVVMLADWFHMYAEGDTPERMKKLGKKLRHIHIAMPNTRELPHADDGYDYTEFFDAVKSMGYDGGISFEGKGQYDETACRNYLKFVKKFI